jgi:tetratricopeptide (TPR) repeat protein
MVATTLRAAWCAAWVAALATPVWANPADLAKARTFYNQRRFDEAIAAAKDALKTPDTQDAAAVVLARAHLERYRENVDPADLSAAREALAAVRSDALGPRDRAELLLGLGQALFLEDEFGAAAQVFQGGLDLADSVDDGVSDAMLDWWGSAVERHAESRDRPGRIAAFAALETRMVAEAVKHPGSAAAIYWSAMAARGAGYADLAWDRAIAGWVRARIAGERADALRADLNRLMVDGVIPDRVRSLPAEARAEAESQLRADWELVKERWR